MSSSTFLSFVTSVLLTELCWESFRNVGLSWFHKQVGGDWCRWPQVAPAWQLQTPGLGWHQAWMPQQSWAPAAPLALLAVG